MINLNEYDFQKLYHIIYYEWHLDIRAGGPTGYLANLREGLNLSDSNNPLIFFDNTEKKPVALQEEPKLIHKIAHAIFYKTDALKAFYINHISQYQKRNHESYVDFLNNYQEMYCNSTLFEKIDFQHTKTIHVHTVGDAVKVRNSLDKMGNKEIKIMLTCHTPEVASNEYYKVYLEEGHNRSRAEEIRKGWSLVEQRAFESADILVFPSKEAMEPLKETMVGFENIIKNKDIRFVATGAKKLLSKLDKEEAKKKYGVEGKFVIGYVGRHNEIKGYDILKEAAKNILPQNEDICFLIGGSQGKTFDPLKHDRWIEAGWVNPAELFRAIDVFVLPNRMTYYDLVLLEVMSIGVPIIASATGGNKSVQAMTNALFLYDNTLKDLAEKIVKLSKMDKNNLEQVSQKVKQAYDENFTPALFAARYQALINQIYKEYHFI